MSALDIASFIRDIIVSLAAVFGAVTAMLGLSTWRRQLKGQTNYELARRILVDLYKYRDAVYGVRHPAIWANEMPEPPESEAPKMSSQKARHYSIAKAYQARWDRVQTEKAKLYADLLDAEALWGDKSRDLLKKAYVLERELFIQLDRYLQSINPPMLEDDLKLTSDERKKMYDTIYDRLSDKPDKFKKEFQVTVKEIETFLKPMLTRT